MPKSARAAPAFHFERVFTEDCTNLDVFEQLCARVVAERRSAGEDDVRVEVGGGAERLPARLSKLLHSELPVQLTLLTGKAGTGKGKSPALR